MQLECQVCNRSGHGNHFGVVTCRACAAFFRRTIVQKKTYKCRRDNGTCSMSESEKTICRHCRYQKCLSLGMTPENVQWDRDILSTTVERLSSEKDAAGSSEEMAADPRPCSSSNSNENSKEKTSTKPGATSRQSSLDKDKWLTIDLTHVMDDLRRIFSQQYRTHVDKRLLVQMFSALEEFRAKKSPYVVFLDVIKFTETIALWETHMYDIASWMMACEDFAVLPLAEKEKLFKHSWFLFDKFERFLMLAQLFGLKAVEEGIALTTNNIAFNMDTVRFEFGSLCDYDPESVRSMFKPFGRQAHQEIVRPVLEMDLDIFEVSYILCSLIWHVEGTDLQPSTLMRAEAVLERISNELHNHYTYDLKMPNYAARLIKLMELIGTTERVLCDMQKMIELARIFDVFKIETTEKGLFIC